MSQLIEAIFEAGVFKPFQIPEINEHEKVYIKIYIGDEWQNNFDSIIKKIHQQTSQYSPEEIESDIAIAIEEVRKEKNDSQSSH